MRDIIAKFEAAQPNWSSKAGTDTQIEFPYMVKICKSYEDPRKSDNILKVIGGWAFNKRSRDLIWCCLDSRPT